MIKTLSLRHITFTYRHFSVNIATMDKLRQLQHLSWCKPDWCFPSTSKETNELLRQCVNITAVEISDDIDELIRKSDAFPIPFPIDSVRLKTLRERKPIETLKRNIASTYPVVHERVLLLMTHFLIYKREFGNSIEKAFYKDMTVPELIDRILQKRAVSFVGPKDLYLLMNKEKGSEGWENIGTLNQKEPLLLENCLSYEELKISAMLFVSSYTECINNGARYNEGAVNEENVQPEAVIIGAIGPRFERTSKMDYEDILITETQNTLENGYGEEVTPTTCLNVLKTTYVRNNQSTKHMWRQMWSEFYQVPSYTYSELSKYINTEKKTDERMYTDRFVYIPQKAAIFDNEAYYKRLCIIAETILLEANQRGVDCGKQAYLNVVGLGLGVWKISSHQSDVYVLSFLERVRSLAAAGSLAALTHLNFAYIKTSDSVKAMFTNSSDGNSENAEMRIFIESKKHPEGGITILFENREPSSRLPEELSDKLLVMTYAWDGNAQPGNEFWIGQLSGSGDSAAACSTQVSELHNCHINPAVSTHTVKVASTRGIVGIREHCAAVVQQ